MKGKINWNKELSHAFAPPAPKKKEAFLKTLPVKRPALSYIGFISVQLHYIRKRVWILSGLFIFISVFISKQPDWLYLSDAPELYSIISSLLPFLALSAIMEITRSLSYGIAELEMTCRFCFQQTVMARILLIGSGNGLAILPVLLITGRLTAAGFRQVTLYLLTPYLLTCGLCLFLLNHLHGREGLYGCGAAACGVSVLLTISGAQYKNLFGAGCIHWWLAALVFISVLIISQLYQLLNKMEERKWNLHLTR